VNAVAIGTGAEATSSVAIGAFAMATGTNSTAVGDGADATGTEAAAFGEDANAVAEYAVAIGGQTDVEADGGTALGNDANVATGALEGVAIGHEVDVGADAVGAVAIGGDTDGDEDGTRSNAAYGIALGAEAEVASGATGGIAIGGDVDGDGTGASASAAGGIALGADALAMHSNSTAIGAGAQTTRANQVVLGTMDETYTLPGLTSPGSAAAQSGPLALVTTDAAGNLASDDGAVFDGIYQNSRRINNVKEDSFRGIASVAALSMVPDPSPGKNFSFGAGVGGYKGYVAAALAGNARFADGLSLKAGLAYSNGADLVGGVGVGFSW
jgi:autotransporter adhesin